jgi:hypothetical protein
MEALVEALFAERTGAARYGEYVEKAVKRKSFYFSKVR